MSVLFKDKITGIWKRAAANLIYASFPVGSIVAYGGSSDVAAPAGCMYCHGQVLNESDYPDLYAVIGTKFGVGDGSAGSFSLPDLQGQFLRGAGTNRDSTQGSGGTVGQRQVATRTPYSRHYYKSNGIAYPVVWARRINDTITDVEYVDKNYTGDIRSQDITPQGNYGTTGTGIYQYTSRPTNTSVEYIIKVVK